MSYTLKLAWRSSVRDRAVLVIVLLTLGFAIGLTTAVFSVLDALVLRPVLVPDADRIVHLGGIAALPDHNEMEVWGAAQSFEALAYYWRGSMNLLDSGRGARVSVAVVSSSFFDVLDARPFLGRGFLPADENSEQADVAVISYGFWRAWFGADSNVLGRTLVLNGRPHPVIGVLAPHFDFPQQTQIWALSRGTDRASIDLFKPDGPRWIGMRRKGVPIEQARAELNVILKRLNHQVSAKHHFLVGETVIVLPLNVRLSSEIRPAIMLLFTGAAVVLAMAILNVSGILLTRAIRRRKESAVQLAVGASRRDLMKRTVAEALLFGVMSGTAGVLALGLASSSISRLFATEGVVLDSSRILNSTTAGFCLLISLLSGIIASAAPALQVLTWDTLRALSDHQGGLGGARGVATRRALVVAEVAMACALVVTAQVAIRSFLNILQQDTGFDPKNTITGDLAWPGRDAEPELFLARQREILSAVAAIPGVVAAGAVSRVPLAGDPWYLFLSTEERPLPAQNYVVGGDYFRAMGVEFTEGRPFFPSERGTAIISENLARRLWQGTRATGRALVLEGESSPRAVVGVVRSVKGNRLDDEMEPQLYLPYGDRPGNGEMSLVVRFDRLRPGLANVLRERTLAASGGASLDSVRTIEEVLAASLAPPRIRATLLGLYSIFAVLLSIAGIYVMVSYIAASRTHEFAVRMVVGADPKEIVSILLRETALTVSAGILLGSAAVALFARAIEHLVYGIRVVDPSTFAISTILLGMAGCLAGLMPAIRASRMPLRAALQGN